MQYHLLTKDSKTDQVESSSISIRPRVQKHDYQIAMFGGSEPQTCQHFNPKGTIANFSLIAPANCR